MVSHSFLLALFVRSLSLLLPQTFFQPDEFYQSLEPAHHLVFGYGHLTWEWKDLPNDLGPGGDGWWGEYVAGGRMRGWIWPSIFAAIYKLLDVTNLDDTYLIAFLPRVIGVLVAATTDYATTRLARRMMGPGASAGALFLSLTSLFNAHLLPRLLSTSPETMLTALALSFFPFPSYITPKSIAVRQPPIVVDGSLNDSKLSAQQPAETQAVSKEGEIVFDSAGDIDYAIMDRMEPHVRPSPSTNLALSIFFAALAICIRPTTLPLWAYLSVDLCIRTAALKGWIKAISVGLVGVTVLTTTLAASTLLDYALTGRLMIPTLTFIHQNVFRNVSAFYGGTNLSYHLVQSLPIMLLGMWWWWAQGFVACLMPTSILPKRMAQLDRPPSLRLLARALTFTIAILSLSPHSEWRFVHPLLPGLLLFALPPLHRDFIPTILGCYRLATSIRQYTRISKLLFYLCLVAPLLPWIYLNMFHGRAQVEVMNLLRRGELGEVTGVVGLMPCHSTPWMSHLHRNVEGWFLTCEPPLVGDAIDHITQQTLFYRAPVSYLQSVFPYQPSQADRPMKISSISALPSHIMLFGELLGRAENTDKGDVTVAKALSDLGYHEKWNGWNGFDILQDESERRGDVRVWTRGE